jgi:hypothetical protein
MTDDDFRDLALALDGASEGAHMGHPDFRANNRIFATLRHDGATGMVKLTPEQQAVFLDEHPAMFTPSPGAWGRGGCTDVVLAKARPAAVRAAMLLALELVMQKPRPRTLARSKPGSGTRPAAPARPRRVRRR